MLNPKNNRLDYGSILSPPSNYEIDFAIGTTYSLDLDALVGASISIGLSQENDSDLNDNGIFLLEALRSTGDKIALFCQSGQIHLPTKVTPLYILLEDIIKLQSIMVLKIILLELLAANMDFHQMKLI